MVVGSVGSGLAMQHFYLPLPALTNDFALHPQASTKAFQTTVTLAPSPRAAITPISSLESGLAMQHFREKRGQVLQCNISTYPYLL